MKLSKYLLIRQASNGSALIMVLWILVLIGFLAGEYLDHNRGKACFAENAWRSLKQKEAVDSVLHLFASDSWPIPGREEKRESWINLSPGGVDLWVLSKNESKRININTAPENRIREKILELMGEGDLDEADRLSDAILDWRDTDSLKRTNGAEADFYESQGLTYAPSDGPFKVLNELLLVRGVTRDLFWGDPIKGLVNEKDETESTPQSIVESFTIYPKDTKRVSIVMPGKGNGYTIIMAFLEKKEGQWDVLHLYRGTLVASGGERQFPHQSESGVESQ